MNSQKMHSSSYWKCSIPSLQQYSPTGTGHSTASSRPLLCLVARGKAIAAVLKDANDFIPLHVVNANMLVFMHSGETVEEKSS